MVAGVGVDDVVTTLDFGPEIFIWLAKVGSAGKMFRWLLEVGPSSEGGNGDVAMDVGTLAVVDTALDGDVISFGMVTVGVFGGVGKALEVDGTWMSVGATVVAGSVGGLVAVVNVGLTIEVPLVLPLPEVDFPWPLPLPVYGGFTSSPCLPASAHSPCMPSLSGNGRSVTL